MTWRHAVVLIIVLAALISALVFKNIFLKPSVERSLYSGVSVSLDPAAITRVEIRKGSEEEPFTLEKKDGYWSVLGAWSCRASAQKIDYVVQGLSSVSGELRLDDAGLLGDFGITDREAFSVSLFGQDAKLRKTFLIGIKRPGSGASFLREAGSNKVYLVNNDLLSLIGIYGDPTTARIERDSWLDLSLFSFDPEQIDAITIEKPVPGGTGIIKVGLKKELDKDKTLMRWVSTAGTMPFDVDAAKIKQYLARLKGAYATKAVDPSKGSYGFDPGTLKIKLSAGAAVSELVLGEAADKDKGDSFALSSNGLAAVVSAFIVNDDLDVDMSQFLIDNPLKFDESSVSSIAITWAGVTTTIDSQTLKKNAEYCQAVKGIKIRSIARLSPGQMLEPATGGISLTGADGKVLKIDIRKSKDGYLGNIPGNDTTFLIDEGSFRSIVEKAPRATTPPSNQANQAAPTPSRPKQ